MKLILTIHAKMRMDQQGLTENHIKRAIQWGAKVPQTDGFVATYLYTRVAYKSKDGQYIIKTVMIER